MFSLQAIFIVLDTEKKYILIMGSAVVNIVNFRFAELHAQGVVHNYYPLSIGEIAQLYSLM
jgi:hypothetical protein